METYRRGRQEKRQPALIRLVDEQCQRRRKEVQSNLVGVRWGNEARGQTGLAYQ